MKIAAIKSAYNVKLMKNTIANFKGGESPGYSSRSCGESPGGGSSCRRSDSRCWGGESPSYSTGNCGESPSFCGRNVCSVKKSASLSFGSSMNAALSVNNSQQLLETRLKLLKMRQSERAKQI